MADEAGRRPVNPSVSSKAADTPRREQEPVHLMVSGSRWGIRIMIHTLFKLGFAPVDAWSKPQQIPHSSKLMSVMTKHVKKPRKEGGQDSSDRRNRPTK